MSDSTMPLYFCCDERRRDAVRGSALNGIDYLEVVDHDALPNEADRQRFLRVHFVNDIAPNSLAAANVAITGGERIRPIVILDATIGTGDDSDVLTVEVEEPGDFSIYTLSLVRGPHDPNPPDEIDPRLACSRFFLQSRMPVGFRLRAEAHLPARAARPAGDQLSGQGLRQFPQADSRPNGAAPARVARAQSG